MGGPLWELSELVF